MRLCGTDPFVLVCFAVKEEGRPFEGGLRGRKDVRVLLTGMGRHNAERAIRAALAEATPGLVLSCGFAGGLNPDWTSGTVLFEAEGNTDLERRLLATGARPGRFHCVARVAATAAEKRLWRHETGADAVEMESRFISAVCRERGISCVTVRVVLDVADEDLPLDFNLLMTDEQQLDFGKLALALGKSPGKIRALLRLRRQSKAAAERLAEVLIRILGG